MPTQKHKHILNCFLVAKKLKLTKSNKEKLKRIHKRSKKMDRELRNTHMKQLTFSS